jgi:polysaccharide pyruvyl transferase WcaK-like protein
MAYRGWYGFAEGGQSIFFGYIDKMADFVVHLLDAGHEVRLLTGDAEDKIAVDALVTAVRSRGCTSPLAYEQPNSLRDVMEQIALTDIVVATRFHNIVCALKMGRPTISLSYAKKNDVLMQEMGLGDYCQHVETFDVETLIAQFARLQSAYRKHEQAIILRLTGLKKQLDDQYRRLLASVIG